MQKSTLSSYLHGFAFDVLPGNKLERDCFLTFSWFLFYGNVCSLKKNLWRRREVAIISLQIILYIFTRRDYYLLCQKFRFLLFHFSSSASSLFFFNSDTQKNVVSVVNNSQRDTVPFWSENCSNKTGRSLCF